MFAMSVWCRKGGVGKTTLSLNLCGYFASKGQSTTLVDFDPQGGALICAGFAEKNGKPLPFEVTRKPKAPTDFMIFDHAPGVDSGGQLAPLVLVPTILDASSYSATLKSIDELKEMKKPFILVPNRVEVQNKEQMELLDKLKGYSEKLGYEQPYIRKRVAYPRAFGNGITIFEDKSGLPNITDARHEFAQLIEIIKMKIKQQNEAKAAK
ncbi:ParA family protein [Pantoea eucrina]|uniref:ParA family protein n=1 Tax=Pantoea eucrina TaxID=472693 RepID=UPI000A240545|nr:ParA family protein [Pantoea eucrina]ORM76492.1 cobalamin biosynthesis protein CobQ [Pantoea eucrina]